MKCFGFHPGSPDKKKAWCNRCYRVNAREQRANGRYRHRAVSPGKDEKCAICGGTSGKRLSYDHCHRTGKFRGWLCTRCNAGIGFFKDDLVLLASAIRYLTKFMTSVS
jgi:hypothetical protein